MLHVKFQDHKTSSAGEEDSKFKGLYNILVWRLSWLRNQGHLYKFCSPFPKEAPHEIGLDRSNGFRGDVCKIIDDEDRRQSIGIL